MKRWYTLRTKPRQEALAASQLERAGIDVYLPQVRVRRERDNPTAEEPFFPNYLFSQLDPDLGHFRLARYSRGVVGILGYGGEPYPVPDELIWATRQRLSRWQGEPGLERFRPGDRVIITSGPLRDVEAIFDERLSATGRVRVLVSLLHRLCRADVHVSQVKPLSPVGALGKAA